MATLLLFFVLFGFFLICDLISRLCEDTVEDIVFFPSRDRLYYFSVDVH